MSLLRTYWPLLLLAALVLWIVLEGRRQERIHGKSRRRGLMRTGLLELQKQLEPERKVEILIEARERPGESAPEDQGEPGGRDR